MLLIFTKSLLFRLLHFYPITEAYNVYLWKPQIKGQTLFTLTANDYVCKTSNKETFHQHFKFSVIKNFSSGCVSGTTVCRRCSFEQQNLVLTVLKTTISKNKPKKQFYRNYKKICSSNFNDDLKAVFKLMLYSCLMTLIKYSLMF